MDEINLEFFKKHGITSDQLLICKKIISAIEGLGVSEAQNILSLVSSTIPKVVIVHPIPEKHFLDNLSLSA